MAYFNTCRHCGAHLDPGEKCGCMKKTPRQMVPDGYEVLTADRQLIKKYDYPFGGGQPKKKPRYVIQTYKLNF